MQGWPLFRNRAADAWSLILYASLALSLPLTSPELARAAASFIAPGQMHPENGGNVTIRVELDELSASDEFVSYALSGDAENLLDYTISPATPLVIPAGQLFADLTVTPVNDLTPEPLEAVVIDLEGQGAWWNTNWRYRAPISIDSLAQSRTDHVAEVPVDFTALLSGLGVVDGLNLDSLRVVEVDGSGNVIDGAVPFQFDPDAGFDPWTMATGTLIFQLGGVTPSGTVRSYHVYFDTALGFSPASVTPQLSFTDGVMDEGQSSYEIVTLNATYLYHKLGGGFSSLVDVNGNDWIDYHETGGAQGNYRGIPNLTHTAGYFHPGLVTSVTSFVASGPLRASFESASADETWRIRWDIFPRHARLTVLAAPEEYWFLYEGAPGGSLDTGSDFIVRADSSQTLTSQAWTGDLVGEEWFYVADPTLGRAIYFVNHSGDSDMDSYWPLSGKMTVLAFGRLGQGQPLAPQMTGAPREFTLGLIDETAYAPSADLIRGASTDLGQLVGAAEDRDLMPITQFTLTLEDPIAVPGLGIVGQGILGASLILAACRRLSARGLRKGSQPVG